MGAASVMLHTRRGGSQRTIGQGSEGFAGFDVECEQYAMPPSRQQGANSSFDDANPFGACPACSMLCICTGFVAGGLGMIGVSLTNTREGRVADYDAAVERWRVARREFAEARFNVTATWSDSFQSGGSSSSSSVSASTAAAADAGRLGTERMTAAEDADWDVDARDGEGGRDMEVCMPLKFVAKLEFPSYYENRSYVDGAGFRPILPPAAEARTAAFEFAFAGHNSSAIRIPAFPLAFDEVVPRMTPAPDTKCRTVQHGIFIAGHCHVAERLATVCVQVEPYSGGWRLSPRPGSSTSLGSRRRRPVADDERYGCNPKTDWAAPVYHDDACWARRATSRCPDEPKHIVTLIIRNAQDPYFRAEELTNNSFDFGLGPRTQRGIGFTLLILGILIGLPPMCWLRRARRKAQRDEEREALTPGPTRMGRL